MRKDGGVDMATVSMQVIKQEDPKYYLKKKKKDFPFFFRNDY